MMGPHEQNNTDNFAQYYSQCVLKLCILTTENVFFCRLVNLWLKVALEKYTIDGS